MTTDTNQTQAARAGDGNEPTITDAELDRIAALTEKAMEEGPRGFCKTWGWQQFARTLVDNLRPYGLRRAAAPAAAPVAWLMTADDGGDADWLQLGAAQPEPMEGFRAVPLGPIGAAPAAAPANDDARDAARYRWIRDNPWPPTLEVDITLHRNARWDREIDAAMAAAPSFQAPATADGSKS